MARPLDFGGLFPDFGRLSHNHVGVRSAETKSTHTGDARVAGIPLDRGGRNGQGIVVPRDMWIRGFEVKVRWNLRSSPRTGLP